MTSTHIYPYVYRGTHPITGEFYIGMRCANKHPAEADLGVKYKTSSKFVKPRFNEFEWCIMAVFFTREAAYDFEQLLIFENMHDSKILNKSCFHENDPRFWNSTYAY